MHTHMCRQCNIKNSWAEWQVHFKPRLTKPLNESWTIFFQSQEPQNHCCTNCINFSQSYLHQVLQSVGFVCVICCRSRDQTRYSWEVYLSHLYLVKPLPGHTHCPSLIDKDINMNESLIVFRCNFKGLYWSSFLPCPLFLWDYWGSVCLPVQWQ